MNTIRKPLFSILFSLVLVLSSATAFAESVPAGLEKTVNGYINALSSGNFTKSHSYTPQALVVYQAKRIGKSVEETNDLIIRLTGEAMEGFTNTKYKFDIGDTKYLKTKGDAQVYAIVPVEMFITASDGQRYWGKSHTLAFQEDGRWKLVDLGSKAAVTALKQVYPQFKNVRYTPAPELT